MSLNTTAAPRALLIAALATPFLATQALAQSSSSQTTTVDEIIVTGTKTGDFGARSGIPALSHSANLSARWTVGPVEWRAAANHVGARKMIDGGAVILPDYTTVDLGAGVGFGDWCVAAAVTNVFDETFYYSDNLFVYSVGTEDRVLPGDPRTFSVRLTRSFGGPS